MSRNVLIEEINQEQIKQDIPFFEIGDTIRISTKIIEGEKERVQVFEGTVIARKGSGLSETFSLHRISYGEGMERVFYLHSPRIVKIQVIKKGDVRRAKLYYLRGTTGKAAKIEEKILGQKKKKKDQLASSSTASMEDLTEESTTNYDMTSDRDTESEALPNSRQR